MLLRRAVTPSARKRIESEPLRGYKAIWKSPNFPNQPRIVPRTIYGTDAQQHFWATFDLSSPVLHVIVEPGTGVVFKVSNRNVKVIPALKEALQLSLLNKEVWCGLLRWIRRQCWLYHIWNLTGVRLVYRKLVPEPEDQPGYRKPSTFALWCLAVYFAAFGLAAQRFESRLDKVEHKSTILYSGPHSQDQFHPGIRRKCCHI